MVLGAGLLIAAFFAAKWSQKRLRVTPEETKIKPGVIIVLVGLGLLFIFGGCSN